VRLVQLFLRDDLGPAGGHRAPRWGTHR
jgi:hypothetical protein